MLVKKRKEMTKPNKIDQAMINGADSWLSARIDSNIKDIDNDKELGDVMDKLAGSLGIEDAVELCEKLEIDVKKDMIRMIVKDSNIESLADFFTSACWGWFLKGLSLGLEYERIQEFLELTDRSPTKERN